MTRKRGGRNNAFKHGGFSQDLILEDEASEDFEQLLQSLIDEWSPTGALEEDTVLTLAQSIWLKRRIERFYNEEATWVQQHEDEEQLWFVSEYFLKKLVGAEKIEDVTSLSLRLPNMYREYIEQFPRTNFDDDQSWIQSVKSNITKLMHVHDDIITDEYQTLSFKGKKAALLRDLTAKKISLDERLDARIDKAIKRLAQLKTFKQVIEVSDSQKSNERRRISDQRR